MSSPAIAPVRASHIDRAKPPGERASQTKSIIFSVTRSISVAWCALDPYKLRRCKGGFKGFLTSPKTMHSVKERLRYSSAKFSHFDGNSHINNWCCCTSHNCRDIATWVLWPGQEVPQGPLGPAAYALRHLLPYVGQGQTSTAPYRLLPWNADSD